MRTHPQNSPDAAARIVALMLLSDGHVDQAELQVLERLGVDFQLEVQPGQFQRVLHDVCDDLIMASGGQWETACQVDAHTRETLFNEISDVDLQATVLRLCTAVVEADQHVADCEGQMLQAAQKQWRPQRRTPP